MAEPKENVLMEKIVSLCKRRGFIFQSSEIYGGINGFWDYGPLGAELKRNVKELWWNTMTRQRDDVAGLEATIIMHPQIWKASGHVDTFSDPMIDCKTCKGRFRADQTNEIPCPQKPSKMVSECHGEKTAPRAFNLMFQTYVGPVRDESAMSLISAPKPRRPSSRSSRTCSKRRAKKSRLASRRSARHFATRSRRAITPSARASSSRWNWNFSSSRTKSSKPSQRVKCRASSVLPRLDNH